MEEQLNVKTVTCPGCGEIFDVPIEAAEAEAPVDVVARFLELTKDIEGAPSKELLEEWKQKHGEVFVFPFNDKLFCVYRPVLAAEYERIVDSVSRLVGQGVQADAERELSSQLAYKCVLWPKITPTQKDRLPAGVIPTMANLIHIVSGFFTAPDLQGMVMNI